LSLRDANTGTEGLTAQPAEAWREIWQAFGIAAATPARKFKQWPPWRGG